MILISDQEFSFQYAGEFYQIHTGENVLPNNVAYFAQQKGEQNKITIKLRVEDYLETVGQLPGLEETEAPKKRPKRIRPSTKKIK